MGFIYIGIAVLVFIIIFNIANRAVNKPKPKQNIEPRRITIDSIKEVSSKTDSSIKKINYTVSTASFDKTIEEALKKHIQKCEEDTPNELKHTPAVSKLMIDSLANYAQSLIDNLSQKPEIKKMFTYNQIESIVDRIQKKVLKEFVYVHYL